MFDARIQVAYDHMKNHDTTNDYGTGYWPGKFFGLQQLDVYLKQGKTSEDNDDF